MKKENQPGNYQLKADLEGNYLIDKEHKATKRLGIFYAPSGGSVHKDRKSTRLNSSHAR